MHLLTLNCFNFELELPNIGTVPFLYFV
uniref:Uncharacterized protein n=1 Tax=Rhizophora mucronata TaxID=61149 RepID=A0A2P2NZJ2_RHIMU